jgi:membrane-anchored protein YejM (alkaline phosphatase superfamily)
MNRRKFALSWGRKLFFGLSWPLTTILSLIYLRSYILPQAGTDWVYFVTTYIGHFGLLNAIAYFIIYVPIVALMPSYYVSRFLSLILILALNLFVLLDALSFSSYHHHIYGFLSHLIWEKGIVHLLGSSTGIVILAVGLFVLGLVIWIRGEMIWRHMQGRFSNPVKNWYLVLILICLSVAKATFYYGELHPKLSAVFPFEKNFSRPDGVKHADNRRFYYPLGELACGGKQNPNIILLVIKEWGTELFNPDNMPSTFHMKRHGQSFSQHYNVSSSAEGGLFSLLYSIPSNYRTAARDVRPAIFNELLRRNYEVVEFQNESDEASMANFRQWILNRSGEEIRPMFLTMTFNQLASDADKFIQEAIIALEKEKLLSNAHVLITGAYSGTQGHLIPLMYFSPDRKYGESNHVTSVYDVMPSLMQMTWNCKKVFKSASLGQPLDKAERDWLLVTGENDFQIVDFKNSNTILVKDENIIDAPMAGGFTQGEARHELIFPAMKMMTKFSKFE